MIVLDVLEGDNSDETDHQEIQVIEEMQKMQMCAAQVENIDIPTDGYVIQSEVMPTVVQEANKMVSATLKELMTFAGEETIIEALQRGFKKPKKERMPEYSTSSKRYVCILSIKNG